MNFAPARLLVPCLAAILSLPLIAIPAIAQDDPGAQIFKLRCVMCHGADGSGNTPAGKVYKAASLTDPMITGKSNDELHAVVKNGKNKMPSFKAQLTDEQIDAVIAYVRKLPQ